MGGFVEAVLERVRRAGIVTATRGGSIVVYELAREGAS